MAGRPGYATLAVLKALASGYRHGFDIIEATGLAGGTVYPVLGKLENGGYIRSSWEDPRVAHAEKRPPRRYYEMRDAGERLLADLLRQFREIEALPRARVPHPRPRRA
jgi:DNA-binding PadR family transcriptional regulator